jgi:RimJ/RimL family protein N-acetyltransferase
MTARRTEKSWLPAKEHLLDGRALVIRALTEDDRQAVVQGYGDLSSRSIYMRFLGYKAGLSNAELDQLTHQHPREHLTLGAEIPSREGQQGVGIARYHLDQGSNPATAEFGVVVADRYHGLGGGTLLIKHLCHEARLHGISCLRGEVLKTNHPMLAVLERFHAQFEPGRDTDTLMALIPLQNIK